jgi:hypothetical protein
MPRVEPIRQWAVEYRWADHAMALLELARTQGLGLTAPTLDLVRLRRAASPQWVRVVCVRLHHAPLADCFGALELLLGAAQAHALALSASSACRVVEWIATA